MLLGLQGWRSGESTHLSSMWPRVRVPDLASLCGFSLWFSSLHREVFSGYSGFPSPQKPAFDLICVNR